MTLSLPLVAAKPTTPRRESLTTRLAVFFRERPGQWVDARTELVPRFGFGGWRTRVSQLRYPPFNMQIDNDWRNVTRDGKTWRESAYRYTPK